MRCFEPMPPLSRRRALAMLAGTTTAVALPGLAFAQSLAEARKKGYLGERPDGYLGQVATPAPTWAINLMSKINGERRQKYAELALKNGTTLQAVEVVAGQKIIASLPPGTYYMDAKGNWKKK